MLTVFHLDHGNLFQTVISATLTALPENTIWLDLYNPTRDEEKSVERLLGLEVPTREEMQEIEASSRLYVEAGGLVMTLPVLTKVTTDEPEASAITLILAGSRLITVRETDPAPFSIFTQRICRQPALAPTGEQALMGLLEQITDSLADILESASADLEKVSRSVFRRMRPEQETPDFNEVLHNIGHVADLSTKAKDSLLNLSRLLIFLAANATTKKDPKARVKTLMRDVKSIEEHAAFLSAKASFLLDATLGLINIEQNNIIKIFSVAATAFLPPTLIASMYGMNFDRMPELKWDYGYPFAIGLMVLSAVLPFWYFRRKKWL